MPWNNQGNNQVEIRAAAHGVVAATTAANGVVVLVDHLTGQILQNSIKCFVIFVISLAAACQGVETQ